MKKIFLASLSILLAFLANEPNKAFAEAHPAVPGSFPAVSEPKLAVSEKLLQEFHESFPNAERINWYESDNRYIVSFVERGILNRITYKKNGSFISSFRYYGEREKEISRSKNFRGNRDHHDFRDRLFRKTGGAEVLDNGQPE